MREIYGTAKEWLEYAKNDLDSAEFLTKKVPVPIEIICYLCQQSAEKALKAFMVEHKIEVIRTHDLGILIEKCSHVSPNFRTISRECSRLTDYAAQSRYPFVIEVEEGDMRLALRGTKMV